MAGEIDVVVPQLNPAGPIVGPDLLAVHQGGTDGELKKIEVSAVTGAGEANTASNVGVGGVGVFKQKTGVDLEFKNVNAASSKISVAEDVPNNEVDIDVVEANLTLDSIGGTLSENKGGTGETAYTDGQLLVGNTGTTGLDKATLTPGSTKISVANGAGSITLDAVEANFVLDNIGGTLSESKGGTGETTYTDGQLLIGNTSSTGLDKAVLIAGSKIVITNGNGTIEIEATLPQGYIQGLQAAFVTEATASIAVGICRDSADSFDMSLSSTATADITVSGVNGLDTGSEAIDSWYSLHLINDSTAVNAPAALFSLSATSPTLPSGYDKFRRVGWIRNNASSNFFNFKQFANGMSRKYHFQENDVSTRALTAGNAIVMTAIDLSAFVPETAISAVLMHTFDNSAGGASSTDIAFFRPTGIARNVPLYQVSPGVKADSFRTQFEMGTDTSQSIDYRVDNASDLLNLSVVGFTDELEG